MIGAAHKGVHALDGRYKQTTFYGDAVRIVPRDYRIVGWITTLYEASRSFNVTNFKERLAVRVRESYLFVCKRRQESAQEVRHLLGQTELIGRLYSHVGRLYNRGIHHARVCIFRKDLGRGSYHCKVLCFEVEAHRSKNGSPSILCHRANS